jgi:cytochrome c-type biogenesis protein
VYCLGLGIPFLVAAVSLRRLSFALVRARKHQTLIMRFGGAMLVTMGILILTGRWELLVGTVRGWLGGIGASPV